MSKFKLLIENVDDMDREGKPVTAFLVGSGEMTQSQPTDSSGCEIQNRQVETKEKGRAAEGQNTSSLVLDDSLQSSDEGKRFTVCDLQTSRFRSEKEGDCHESHSSRDKNHFRKRSFALKFLRPR